MLRFDWPTSATLLTLQTLLTVGREKNNISFPTLPTVPT